MLKIYLINIIIRILSLINTHLLLYYFHCFYLCKLKTIKVNMLKVYFFFNPFSYFSYVCFNTNYLLFKYYYLRFKTS